MKAESEQIIHHIPKLRRYARGLTGNKEQADDLVQDSLTRALSKIGLWKKDTNLQRWLFTIMHNIFVNDRKKKCNNINSVPFEEQTDIVDVGAEPEQSMITEDMCHLLMRLSPAHREVLLLVGVEGQTYEEVGIILSIPVGTVMSRLHRAREVMRQNMAEVNSKNNAQLFPLRRVK